MLTQYISDLYYKAPYGTLYSMYSIYNKTSFPIPKDYKYVGFYPPTAGQVYIDVDFDISVAAYGFALDLPRIIVASHSSLDVEIYGNIVQRLPIPQGYEVVAFRKVQMNDTFLTNRFDVVEADVSDIGKPRIILKKRAVVVSKDVHYVKPVTRTVKGIYTDDVTIPSGYKYLGFRPPMNGEMYLSTFILKIETATHNFEEPRIIVEKE